LNNPFSRQVDFVGDKHQNYIRVPFGFNFFDPLFYIAEGLPPGHIEHDQRCCRGPIIGAGNATKLLLAGCIPYLQFDAFLIDGDKFGSEFDSYSELVVNIERSSQKATEDTGLPHCSVSHEDELECKIKGHVL
jgi:hypothetical protein